jgi:hypothetical protein
MGGQRKLCPMKYDIPEPCEPVGLGEFFLEERRFPAVYFLYHRGEVVYVGQTRTLHFRIDQHLSEGVKKFDAVGFVRCKLNDLLRYESHYIQQLAPKYNACGLSKKVRERDSWSRKKNQDAARRPDAFRYQVEGAADCGIVDETGECYIRPKEIGKFLMISDRDAAEIFGAVKENIPLMQLLYIVAACPDVRRAQERFESTI